MKDGCLVGPEKGLWCEPSEVVRMMRRLARLPWRCLVRLLGPCLARVLDVILR